MDAVLQQTKTVHLTNHQINFMGWILFVISTTGF